MAKMPTTTRLAREVQQSGAQVLRRLVQSAALVEARHLAQLDVSAHLECRSGA
jgi:hypothetical protein